jgi:hypothetical protein
MRVGKLSINASPEQNCEVYLNGRHLGHTPFTLDRAPTGDYRAQVECAGANPTRVHVVHLGDDPVELTVHADFDAAIEAGPRMALRYANEELAHEALVRHAALLGQETRADDVVLVGTIAGKHVILRVQAAHQRLVGGAVVETSLGSALARVSEALTQGRFLSLDPNDYRRKAPGTAAHVDPFARPGVQPVGSTQALSPRTAAASLSGPAANPAESVPNVDRTAGDRALVVTGSVLTATGVAGLGAGFGLFVHTRALRNDAERGELGSPEQQARQHKYDDLRLIPLVGVAGAVLVTAGVPMLLPKHAPRSAAAWAGGALAGAAGIAAIAFGAAKTPAEPVLGGLLMSVGAPLLSIPITQLVRAGK